jgi:hypothetical protein
MKLIGTEGARRKGKVRELYEALRREENGEDPTEKLTCESALREAGVDESLIAKKLKEQLEAKQPRWNPRKKAFDLFADHDARLAALREVVRIFGGHPSPSENNQAPLIIDFTDSALSPLRRSDGRERREHCQADTKVPGTAAEPFGNRTISKP